MPNVSSISYMFDNVNAEIINIQTLKGKKDSQYINKVIEIPDKKILISYKPSWSLDDDKEQILQRLHEQRDLDIRMLTTTSGPHRDRFILSDQNGIFTNSASTGQMRLASLIFRSAQATFYRQKTGLNPIFLIDDVLLELDNGKRARYLNCLGSFNQAFFTFLPDLFSAADCAFKTVSYTSICFVLKLPIATVLVISL